jgi:hypothetical protein
MRRSTAIIMIAATVLLTLAACGGGQGDPATSVEGYLDALVSKDADRIVTLSCADWEDDAIIEVDSLEAVDARLEDVSCEQTGTDGETALVLCGGSIVLTYNGEDRPIDLAARTYQVVQSGGEWLVCGYR